MNMHLDLLPVLILPLTLLLLVLWDSFYKMRKFLSSPGLLTVLNFMMGLSVEMKHWGG